MQLILYQLFSIDYPNEADPFEAAILVGYTLILTNNVLTMLLGGDSEKEATGEQKVGERKEEKVRKRGQIYYSFLRVCYIPGTTS